MFFSLGKSYFYGPFSSATSDYPRVCSTFWGEFSPTKLDEAPDEDLTLWPWNNGDYKWSHQCDSSHPIVGMVALNKQNAVFFSGRMFNYCRILDPRLPIGKKINEYIVFIVIYNVQDLQDESNHGSFCLPWPHAAKQQTGLMKTILSWKFHWFRYGAERSWFSPVKSMAIEMVPIYWR